MRCLEKRPADRPQSPPRRSCTRSTTSRRRAEERRRYAAAGRAARRPRAAFHGSGSREESGSRRSHVARDCALAAARCRADVADRSRFSVRERERRYVDGVFRRRDDRRAFGRARRRRTEDRGPRVGARRAVEAPFGSGSGEGARRGDDLARTRRRARGPSACVDAAGERGRRRGDRHQDVRHDDDQRVRRAGRVGARHRRRVAPKRLVVARRDATAFRARDGRRAGVRVVSQRQLLL